MVKIIPYVSVDGIPTFKDSDIKGLYERMVQEGTADAVFYSGEIKNANEFLSAMASDKNFLIVVYWENEVAAIMWANRFQSKWAQNHFCCFKNVWGKHEVIHEMGRVACLYLLDALKLDALFSMIPETNKPALYAVLGAGATKVGTVPNGTFNYRTGKSEPAVWVSFIKEGNEHANL